MCEQRAKPGLDRKQPLPHVLLTLCLLIASSDRPASPPPPSRYGFEGDGPEDFKGSCKSGCWRSDKRLGGNVWPV